MRVVTILGTRPEVIKLAPVVAELRRNPTIESIVVSTGQHREMLDQMLDQFELATDIDLDVMRRKQRLCDLTADLVRGLGETLASLRPDWVLVQGDTSTTLCGALAAFYEGVAVAHVEAGLRSGDNRAPFPEEANRRLVTCLATLHFCPTAQSAANLLREAVPEEQVFVTGNTVIDALQWAVQRARLLTPSVPRKRPASHPAYATSAGEPRGSDARRLCRRARTRSSGGYRSRVPSAPQPRRPRHRASRACRRRRSARARATELPLPRAGRLLDSCDIVLTDSGGLQEEGPTLGKPVLVLRDTTERPEAVEAGVARLVGTNPSAIVNAAAALLDDPVAYEAMAHPENPFGDGRARFRIVRALTERRALSPAA